jgi:hypothetical protein
MVCRVSAVNTGILNSQILGAIKLHEDEPGFRSDRVLSLSTMQQVLQALPMEVVGGC